MGCGCGSSRVDIQVKYAASLVGVPGQERSRDATALAAGLLRLLLLLVSPGALCHRRTTCDGTSARICGSGRAARGHARGQVRGKKRCPNRPHDFRSAGPKRYEPGSNPGSCSDASGKRGQHCPTSPTPATRFRIFVRGFLSISMPLIDPCQQSSGSILAELARGRMCSKRDLLAQALQGQFKPHHRFLLSEQLADIDAPL
jgi:hypothetical protein